MLTIHQVPENLHLTCWGGTDEDFASVNWDVLTQQFGVREERILFSSIRLPNGHILAILKPGRHHHVIRAIAALWEETGAPKVTLHNQGFLTNFGRWVDRKEACVIAERVKQIIKKSDFEGSTTLFSECIWETPELYAWKPEPMASLIPKEVK